MHGRNGPPSSATWINQFAQALVFSFVSKSCTRRERRLGTLGLY